MAAVTLDLIESATHAALVRHGCRDDIAADVAETEAPDTETLDLIRGEVGAEIAATYPKFARETLGVAT